MKKRYEIILLDALWLSAMALFANFWFDIRFGFNIFYAQHWHYLAVQQLTPGRVLPLFYISMGGFLIATVAGLYFISRPKQRKISFASSPETPPRPLAPPMPMEEPQPRRSDDVDEGSSPPNLRPMAKDPEFSPLPKAPALPRPPRIISPMHAQRMPERTERAQQAETRPLTVSPAMAERLKEIFEDSGYTVKRPPKVGDTKLDLWAVGMDEVLYAGLADPHGGEVTATEGGESKWSSDRGGFVSPVWRVTTAAEKVRALFAETLDSDIQITVKPFVVMNNARIANRESLARVWEAFGVNVFESTDALQEFMRGHRNREMPESEKEDFDAYSEYIDTVADYFNKT